MAIPLPNADVAYFGGHPVDQPRGRDGEGARGGAAGRRRGVSVVNTREEDSDAVGILRDREGKRRSYSRNKSKETYIKTTNKNKY